MQLFLLEKIDDTHGRLKVEEYRHCIQVLRHQVGDKIHGIDGMGNMYLTQIERISKKEVEVTLLQTESEWGEKKPVIQLGISPLSKKDRFEWLLEKSVELGVNSIIPVLCERSYKSRLPSEKRMNSILLSALKQCKRSRLPVLAEPESLESLLLSDTSEVKIIAWCKASQPLSGLHTSIADSTSVSILIGPEGDFSDREVEMAINQDIQPVLLGVNRLRSETAGIFLLSSIKTICGY